MPGSKLDYHWKESNLDNLTENEQVEQEESVLLEPQEQEKEETIEPRPAMVINVFTWATPIVGLIMLVIGLVAGYLIYPELSVRIGGATPVAVAPGVNPSGSTSPSSTGSQVDPANRQEMMEFIISQTRHFKGNPDAEVTIIEFSDFQ